MPGAFTQHREEQMLRAHFVVAESSRFIRGEPEDAPQRRRHDKLSARLGRAHRRHEHDGRFDLLLVDAGAVEKRRGQSAGLIEEPQQQMLRAKPRVPQSSRGHTRTG